MRIKASSKYIRIVLPLLLVLIWFGVSAVGGPYFGRIEEVSEVDLTAFLPKSAEATKVSEKLSRFQNDDALPAIVVFESSKGDLTESQTESIESVTKQLNENEGVIGTVSPALLSDDKEAAFSVVNLDTNESLETAVEGLKETIAAGNLSNITTHVTGPAGFAADLNVAFAGIDGILLLTALAVVFIILIIVYRSVLLPIIVLLTSIFALSASILIVFTLATLEIVELNGQVQGILFILVIGAATDYSLLYVSRYRESLYKHKLVWQATQDALKGSFEPILASGGTVIVGLLCLLLSDLASNKALGPVGSIGVAMAMLAALTFLPAALHLVGRAGFWPIVPDATLKKRREHTAKLEKGIWHRVGEFVKRSPRRIWIGTTLLLILAACFAPSIKADGVAQSELILGFSEAREGQRILGEHFPSGSGSPALVVVREKDIDEAVRITENVPGVESVAAAATGVESGFAPLGKSKEKIEQSIRSEIELAFTTGAGSLIPADRRQALVDTATANAYPFTNAKTTISNEEALLQVTLKDDPNTDAAKDTISELRTAYAGKVAAQVGGPTAAQLDTNTASIRDRAVIIPVVLVAITFILMLLLRAIVAPILLLATTVLSFAASLGVAAILFNTILKFPGADPSVILYGFVFLVALGIDYNIFLMTRVREESLKIGTSKGVIKGLVVTGGVITSAGVVLAATFAALGVIPILFLFQLAFIVAFGVLLDTIVVRSLLVPALIKDIGSKAWWPSKVKE